MNFDDIYEKYHKFVFYSCRKFTGDDNIALDAMQEVFVSFYESMDAIRDAEKVKSWLYVCAKNTALNMMRRMGRIYRNEDAMPDITVASGADTENDYIKLETIKRVREIMEQMDTKYEMPLRLKYILEYAPREIAEMLRLPLATVYTRIRRGEKILRENLSAERIGTGEEEL